MYPYSSLPENLTAFCAVLRRDYGFRVGPRQVHDAARALELAAIADDRAVRDTLRPILSGTREHAQVFDLAFGRFFHPGVRSRDLASPLPDPVLRDADAPTLSPASTRTAGEAPPSDDVARRAAPGADLPMAVTDTDGEQKAAILRSSYSPVEAEGQPPALEPVDRLWRDAAQAFVRRVQMALSRRWKPAARGARFDLRRTLRASLHTGGEPVLARWQARPRLRPRFVVIVDGSRSMAAQSAPALRTAVAIASVAANVEVFAFSTALQRITPEVRRAAAGDRRRLPDLHHAWGGGTGIGHCLREFVHRYGDRLLGRDTVLLIVSDGLDVGHPDVLRQAMTELHRRSAAIVWLNPLLDTPGYEPAALGMRVARPFVRTFAWAGDPDGLARLSRSVRVA